MRKLLALLTLFPALAAAGPHQDLVAKQERCRTSGELAQAFHGAQKTVITGALDDAKLRVKKKTMTKKKYDELVKTVMEGVTAKTPKDAYMRGWAVCMDVE